MYNFILHSYMQLYLFNLTDFLFNNVDGFFNNQENYF